MTARDSKQFGLEMGREMGFEPRASRWSTRRHVREIDWLIHVTF